MSTDNNFNMIDFAICAVAVAAVAGVAYTACKMMDTANIRKEQELILVFAIAQQLEKRSESSKALLEGLTRRDVEAICDLETSLFNRDNNSDFYVPSVDMPKEKGRSGMKSVRIEGQYNGVTLHLYCQ
jgi:hypothetical protein